MQLCDGALACCCGTVGSCSVTGRRPMQCCTRRVGPVSTPRNPFFVYFFSADLCAHFEGFWTAQPRPACPLGTTRFAVIRKFRKLAKPRRYIRSRGHARRYSARDVPPTSQFSPGPRPLRLRSEPELRPQQCSVHILDSPSARPRVRTRDAIAKRADAR